MMMMMMMVDRHHESSFEMATEVFKSFKNAAKKYCICTIKFYDKHFSFKFKNINDKEL